MNGFARNVFSFFLLILLGSCSARAAEIRLLSTVRADKPILRLGDIARVRDQDAEAAERLARLELIAAPSAGKSRNIRHSEVRELLTLRGVDLRSHRMSGALNVRITTPTEASTAAAKASLPRPRRASGLNSVIRQARLESSQQVSPSEVAKPMTTVLVTKRAIRRNELIRAQDVRMTSVEASKQGDSFDELASVIGQVSTRAMPTNYVVKSRDVQRPLLVRRSDIVTLVVRSGAVRVSTSAKAMQDGAAGDVVRVESLDRKKRDHFTARVVGPNHVEIQAGPPVVETPIEVPVVNRLRNNVSVRR